MTDRRENLNLPEILWLVSSGGDPKDAGQSDERPDAPVSIESKLSLSFRKFQHLFSGDEHAGDLDHFLIFFAGE
jgi:hypothetical protein